MSDSTIFGILAALAIHPVKSFESIGSAWTLTHTVIPHQRLPTGIFPYLRIPDVCMADTRSNRFVIGKDASRMLDIERLDPKSYVLLPPFVLKISAPHLHMSATYRKKTV